MNVQALKNASEYSGPVVLIVGASLVTLAFVGVGHDRPASAAPAATRTVTAPPVTVSVTPTTPASASSTPSSGAAGHESTAATQSVSTRSTATRPGAGTPSGPSPRPTISRPPAACGGVLSVRALSASACLKLRGTR